MSLFNTKTYTVTRKAAGSYSETTGRWTDGTSSTFSASGTLQPMSGDKMKALMEGNRLISAYAFITGTKLIATDPDTGITGDSVALDDGDYEVQAVEQWSNILPHYECTLVRNKEVPEVSS